MSTKVSRVGMICAELVRGASKGEGLGNQFLANIRECDAIAHVLRCFEDPDVTHVEGRVDPVADAETVGTELMLADLESVDLPTFGSPTIPIFKAIPPSQSLRRSLWRRPRRGQAGAPPRMLSSKDHAGTEPTAR